MIESKDILSYLGIEADSLDKFQENFTTSFIKKDPNIIADEKDLYAKILGKKTGVIESAMKRALKRNGIEIKADEIKDAYTEDAIEYAIDKTFKTNFEKVKTLEEQLSKGTDEKHKTLLSDLEKIKNDYNVLISSNTSLKTEYDTYKNTAESEKKNIKKSIFEEKLLNAIEWASTAKDNELIKEGFISKVKKNFNFDLDDNGDFIVTDTKGNKIANPKVNSTFKSPIEVVKEFGIENNVWAINPHDQKPKPVVRQEPAQQPIVPNPGQRLRMKNPMIPTGA